MKSLLPLYLTVICLGLIAGCSGKGLSIVPVRGTVTFAGGPPPTPGTITFMPLTVAEGLPHRPGSADFNTTGQYQATSFHKNDGLVVGTYRASIQCWKQPPSASDPSSFERFNLVPKDYQPPDITVDADSSEVVVNFDVPKKQ
jgi:hypothetical protein